METTQTPLQNIRYNIKVKDVSLLKLLYFKLCTKNPHLHASTQFKFSLF